MKFDTFSGSARSNRRRSQASLPQAVETCEARTLLSASSILSPNGTIGDARPTITWEAVDNAASYELWISNLETNQLISNPKGIGETNYRPATDLPQAPIRVWVRATFADSSNSAWSPSHDFTVSGLPLVTGPGNPAARPANRLISDTTPVIEWSGTAGANTLEVFVSNRTTKTSEVYRDIPGETFHSRISVDPATATDGFSLKISRLQDGQTSPSVSYSALFQPNTSPTAVQTALRQIPGYEFTTVSSSFSNDQVVSYLIRFYGQPTSVNSIEVELLSASPAGYTVSPTGTESTLRFEIPEAGKLPIGQYEVFVRSQHPTEGFSQWTSGYQFTVAPQAVVTSPIQYSQQTIDVLGTGLGPIQTVDNRPLLTWDAVESATHYELWFSRIGDESKQRAFYLETDLTATSFQLPRELNPGRYVFWVRGKRVSADPTIPVAFGQWSSRTEILIPQNIFTPQVSKITKTGGTQSGSFQIRLNLGTSTYVTPGLVHSATAAQVQAALRSLPGMGSVVVTAEQISPSIPELRSDIAYVIQFNGIRGGVVVSVLNYTDRGVFDVELVDKADKIIRASPTIFPIQGEDTNTPGTTLLRALRPEIKWSEIGGAVRYEVWVNKAKSDAPFLQTSSSINSFQFAENLPQGDYTVWVRAFSRTGVATQWSSNVQFTSSGGVTEITSPVTGANTTARPEIQWYPVGGAASYDIWVAAIGVNFQFIRDSNITETTYTPTFDLPAGNYRVWVRAVDSSGTELGWSSAVDFTVVSAHTPADQLTTVLTSIPLAVMPAALEVQAENGSDHKNAGEEVEVDSPQPSTPSTIVAEGEHQTPNSATTQMPDSEPDGTTLSIAVARLATKNDQIINEEQLKTAASQCEQTEWWTA